MDIGNENTPNNGIIKKGMDPNKTYNTKTNKRFLLILFDINSITRETGTPYIKTPIPIYIR